MRSRLLGSCALACGSPTVLVGLAAADRVRAHERDGVRVRRVVLDVRGRDRVERDAELLEDVAPLG